RFDKNIRDRRLQRVTHGSEHLRRDLLAATFKLRKIAWGDMSASSKLAQSHAFVSAEGTQCQSKCFTQQGLGMTNTSTVRCGSCMGNSSVFEECSRSIHYLLQRRTTSICSRVSKNIYFPRLKAIQQDVQITVLRLCANFIALPAEYF